MNNAEVFSRDWVQQQRDENEKRPMYTRPFSYYFATSDKWRDLRDEIEKWVSELPKKAKKDIITRLRGRIDGFIETYNELSVGAALSALGYQKIYEPKLNGKTPDWKAFGKVSVPPFIIECVSVRGFTWQRRHQDYTDRLHGIIKQLKVGALLDISVTDPDFPYDIRQLEVVYRTLHEWIASDQITTGDYQNIKGLRFEVVAVDPSLSKTIGIGPALSFAVDDKKLRTNIQTKLDRYHKLATDHQLALVIAVVTDFVTALDFDNLVHVLTETDGIMETSSNKDGMAAGLWVRKIGSAQWSIKSVLNREANFPLPDNTFSGESDGAC